MLIGVSAEASPDFVTFDADAVNDTLSGAGI
jgi:hypothetical protein